jgi:hypothetical protein
MDAGTGSSLLAFDPGDGDTRLHFPEGVTHGAESIGELYLGNVGAPGWRSPAWSQGRPIFPDGSLRLA